jgi:hypothetical protein
MKKPGKEKPREPLTITEFARMGGNARAKKLTKKQRLASSRKAILAWKAKARARRDALTKSLSPSAT